MHVVRAFKNKEKTLSNMTKGKTVAVVMCTYNGGMFLREQLDSILRQTYPISEIIVQDDCSTDDTMDILRSYAARDSRVRVTRNAVNLGFNRNFRSAVMKATADFVAISDQDDVWMPDKIELMAEAIGDYNICYSDHLRGTTMETAHTVSPRCSLEALMFGGFAGHTMLLRRDYVQREDVWMEGIYYDWSLGLNAWFHGEKAITHISKPLNWHRSHPREAALLQSMSAGPAPKRRPTWQPYVLGIAHYRRLQRKPTWQRLYSHIMEHTRQPRFRLHHTMARLMLSRSPLALLRLCAICMSHRRDIYPDAAKARGVMGMVRGFFHPMIFAYRCSLFDL